MLFKTLLSLVALATQTIASPIAVPADAESAYSSVAKRAAIPDNLVYSYYGCYADDGHRALPNGLYIGDQGTNENMYTICHGIANQNNALYFALQAGVFCFYAKNDDFKLHGPGICNNVCGNSASTNAATCGGNLQNQQPTLAIDNARYFAATSLYKTYLYRGCYNDADKVRILPTLWTIPSNNRWGQEVFQSCYNKALSVAGTTYFGLRDGINCYYGADSDPLTKLSPAAIVSDSQCSRDCGQTSDDDLLSVEIKCGGNNRMSVYELMK